MPVFRTSGSTGQAPTTVWFGAIPDRLNMLARNQGGVSTLLPITGTLAPLNYANLWPLNNVTLGATIAAPDGTTANSQAIIEDTSNGTHYLSATITPFNEPGIVPQVRLIGIWKYNGRRVVLQASHNDGSTSNVDGVYAVFDLLNGQIGVPVTVFRTGAGISKVYQALGTSISPLGGGWYLCSLDFSFRTTGSFVLFVAQVLLDNGTGTNPLSVSYTGNGTSGIYGWRTNLMPAAAYAMNNVTLFDDFNDLSSIDVNNTRAPGFTWYPYTNWTNVFIQPAAGPSTFSVNSSVLTTHPNAVISNGVAASSTFETVPGSWYGKAFKPPYLWETRWSAGLDVGLIQFGIGQGYGISQEWLSAQGVNPTNPTVLQGREIDYGEWLGGGGGGSSAGHMNDAFIPDPVGGGEIGVALGAVFSGGTPPYESAQNLSSGPTVLAGGVRYEATTNVPAGNPPPNPTYWSVNNYPGGGFPNLPPILFDYKQMHTYSFLVLPYYGAPTRFPGAPEQVGSVWVFIDGLMQQLTDTYAPNIGASYNQNVEWQSMPFFLGADNTGGVPQNWDYVRVTQ